MVRKIIKRNCIKSWLRMNSNLESWICSVFVFDFKRTYVLFECRTHSLIRITHQHTHKTQVPRTIRLPTCHGAVSPVKQHSSRDGGRKKSNNKDDRKFSSSLFSKNLMCSPKMRRMKRRAESILNSSHEIDMHHGCSSLQQHLPKLYGCLSPMSLED